MVSDFQRFRSPAELEQEDLDYEFNARYDYASEAFGPAFNDYEHDDDDEFIGPLIPEVFNHPVYVAPTPDDDIPF